MDRCSGGAAGQSLQELAVSIPIWPVRGPVQVRPAGLFIHEHNHKNNAGSNQLPQLTKEQASAYWRRNISLVVKLLAVWFVVSYGCGILLVDTLNQFQVGGYKLGFWFAQQGSVYVFIVLVFYYARRMAALDREFDLDQN